ncbi:MAG TPA: cell division protein FtsZ [Gammaproteobacteria bacterium]|jgi:cell division protein FtsZ|nr:cell division protein FtsZ [Acidiferrobacteraceae bacterium]MDP6397377.1 cell division protein FtsZ [Arenicellales bacterium]HCX88691.1 cell division protein FtsZ [Gammaproteobacteria bacterium]MDP6551751.1 cell division protein FtsZ [Arenicellales bacterium]MDP6791459.1 cell division protein FtsZ [Arenicellales bacterium]|tara:strand:+ start:16229 stop:17371 length:1143 start_codon:yes stop_codon:yes gene_type:complete
MFELMEVSGQQAVIKVIGIGGGGGNAVDHMLSASLEGVEFINANTDAQALHRSGVSKVMQLGEGLTRGLGAGSNPEVGRQAASEDRDKIAAALEGADMVFLTAGMGGGTGTGAAPVVAQLAREKGILTVAVVTRPFGFEGKKRIAAADHGIKELGELVDSLIIIPNERIMEVMGGNVTLLEAFGKANEVLFNAVQGISELITRPGLINVDFADVRTVMAEMGMAMMGSATAAGPDRAMTAARAAVSSPLLEEVDIHGAKGLLVNVSAGPDMQLDEFAQVGEIVNEYASEDGTVVIGTVLDPEMEDELRVTMVATGIRQAPQISLVKDGGIEEDAPEAIDYDQPTVIRRRPRAAGDVDAQGNAAVDMDYLDVPAFLRRQAD